MTLGSVQQQFLYSVQASLAPFNYQHETAIDYVEPINSTASSVVSNEITVAPATSNQVLNLSTMFAGITNSAVISIQDVTTPQSTGNTSGFNIKTASGDPNLISVAPNGVFSYRATGAPPILYIDNPSGTTTITIQISIIGS